MENLLRTGSSKDVLSVTGIPNQLDFHFSDRVSVFDVGPIPVEFPHLGRPRCAIAGSIFRFLNAVDVPTPYIDHDVDRATMRVHAANIPEKNFFREGAIGRLMGVELLFRYEISPGTYDRIVAGLLDRGKFEALLAPGEKIQPGARLQSAFMECSTKWQDADDYVSDEDAAELAQVSPETLEEIYQRCREISEILRNFFRPAGFDLRDGKFEAIWPFRLADSISPDELRLVGPDGRSYDKDPVRKWYELEQSEWVQRLRAAKKLHRTDRTKWPTYEAVPPREVIEEQVLRYHTVAEAIGAI